MGTKEKHTQTFMVARLSARTRTFRDVDETLFRSFKFFLVLKNIICDSF